MGGELSFHAALGQGLAARVPHADGLSPLTCNVLTFFRRLGSVRGAPPASRDVHDRQRIISDKSPCPAILLASSALEHNHIADSHKTVLECKNSRLYVYLGPSLQVIYEKGKTLWTKAEHRRGDAASSSTQPIEEQYGLRHPDYVITSTRPNSTGSSSSDAEDSKIEWPYPYREKLKAVMEITSDSTRSVDLYTKWAAYARSNVPLYVIFDRGTATSGKKVIIGSLKQFSKDPKRMAHGDPDPSKRRKPMPNDENTIYCRKVYSSYEKVDCPYFDQLDMTVKQFLDVIIMQKLSKEMYHGRASQKKRADDQEKPADEQENLDSRLHSRRKKKRIVITDNSQPQPSEWMPIRKVVTHLPSLLSHDRNPQALPPLVSISEFKDDVGFLPTRTGHYDIAPQFVLGGCPPRRQTAWEGQLRSGEAYVRDAVLESCKNSSRGGSAPRLLFPVISRV